MTHPVTLPRAHSTLVDLLQFRATNEPDTLAYTFLVDGEREGPSLTYGTLDARARAIGASLRAGGISGQRALLLYDTGLEFVCAFFGCLYAEVTAVPAPPPSPFRKGRTMPRIRGIIDDAQPAAILATSQVLSGLTAVPDDAGPALPWIATDRVDTDAARHWTPASPPSTALAYLQDTSGSTAAPKGVMITHENVLQNLAHLDRDWEHQPHSLLVSWLPVFHDMGLVYGILQGIYSACPCYLLTPFAFLREPIRWLRTMSRLQATHSGAPNFAYDLCVDKTTPDERLGLDLRHWKVAANGAETVRAETLNRFATTFEPFGFSRRALCPGYGLAEATLKVTAIPHSEMPTAYTVRPLPLAQGWAVRSTQGDETDRTVVSCGRPAGDILVRIVNPELSTACAANEVGEVWVSGSVVSAGYWKRPQESERTFRARLADSVEGPFLRTGDVGFLHDGELFITGRLKDLVIVRGLNHYPEDIERTAQGSHEALAGAPAAAFSIDADGEERLVVVHEIGRHAAPVDMSAIPRAIRAAVSESHEIEAFDIVLVAHGSLAKTSSGKLERHSCRAAFESGTLKVLVRDRIARVSSTPHQGVISRPFVAPRTDLEAAVTALVAEVLEVERIGIHHDFFDLGGDSLRSTQILSRIRKRFGVELPPDLLFAVPTVADLAAAIVQWTAETRDGSATAGDAASGRADWQTDVAGLSDAQVEALIKMLATPERHSSTPDVG